MYDYLYVYNISIFIKITYGFIISKYIFYTIEIENLKSDELHPKPIMGGNSERQEEEGRQGEGGEVDRDGKCDECVDEVKEKPQNQKEKDQHQLEGQAMGEREQEAIYNTKSNKQYNNN